MNKNNTIIWQKWIDPFGEDDLADLYSNLDNDNLFEEDRDEDIGYDSVEQKPASNQPQPVKKHIKVINTPMGIIPFTENTASSKIFNFWVGHTNFNISKKIVSLIEETDGVESLDIFTRYRFRISVGKAFDDSIVMRNINNNIYSYLG